VRPIGARDSIDIDVRFISATDVDLEKSIAEKRFRSPGVE
jgi:transcriptional regulator with PAS, ATPase and Fis domain